MTICKIVFKALADKFMILVFFCSDTSKEKSYVISMALFYPILAIASKYL